mmetsp:Transcript_59367/g.170573  ORF Transcript_59367/g.170573 Transcript_59367/m.170573 type:complete len:183 (+) Transcript_59367:94-642(+)
MRRVAFPVVVLSASGLVGLAHDSGCIALGERCDPVAKNSCCDAVTGEQMQCDFNGRHPECSVKRKGDSCLPIGHKCDLAAERNDCCKDPVGAPLPCADMGKGPECISGLERSPRVGDRQECPYFGKPCLSTPKGTCGWDDPDPNVRAACQHGNVVCGDDDKGSRVCVLGPPLSATPSSDLVV